MRNTSLRYYFLRFWVRLGLHVYFRDIEVSGKQHIPAKGPVIFAVNHPNTVLDALLTAGTNKRHSWFMAHGMAFKFGWLNAIFRSMRMLPVFRESEGTNAVKQNTEIFAKCSRILSRNGSLIMFPEGSHSRMWKIRDMRKGLARIVHETVKHNENLVVIPVGITYFDPLYAFSDVLIQYGEPISAAEYFKNPEENDVQSQLKLMKAISTKLEQLTLHISGSDYKDIYTRVKQLELSSPETESLLNDFKRLQSWIEACEKDPELGHWHEDVVQKVTKKTLPLLALIFTAPLWLTGKVLTIIPQLCIRILVKRLKDDHFAASVRFGAGLGFYTFIVLGIGIWSWMTTLTLFWFLFKWVFFTFSMFFVMMWEEHLDAFRNKRFSK